MSKTKTLQPQFGKAIRKIRKKQKMLIESAALLSRISIKKLLEIEQGKHLPTKAELGRLSKAFDIPKELLFVLCMNKKDVPKHKREAYKILVPTMKKVIYELI